MKPLLSLAVITFKEGIRSRAMYGISLLALILMIVNVLISSMMMQDVGKVAVDMALSTVSFVGLLLVLFVGINLVAKDLERKTIYMVLARPISRSQYIWGKFMGIAALIVISVVILGLFAIASIVFLKGSYPEFFTRFSWLVLLLSLSFTTMSLIIVSAMSFLFASFSSTSFISLVLTIVSYLIGSSSSEVKALLEIPHDIGDRSSPIILYGVKVAYYVFPNLSLFDIKTQAAHGLAISASYVFWTFSYGVAYCLIILLLASFIFNKREFA
jgi:ABC-type transport system involved in multi-copper enzyme maturation permease subunit